MLPPPTNVVVMPVAPNEAICARAPAHRRSPCRPARASRPRRSRPRGRPTFPSTGCPPAVPTPCTRPGIRAGPGTARAAGRASSVGSGMPMIPRRRSRGNAATAFASATASSGAIPLFEASPLAFTCTQTSSGGALAGRAAESRSAIFARSTVCTHANRAAAIAALLLCRGPIRCHSIGARSASASILRDSLLHVVLAELALAQRVDDAYRLGRKRLADRDEPNAVRVAADRPRRVGDPRLHVLPRLLVVEHNRTTSRTDSSVARSLRASPRRSARRAPGVADRTRDYRWTSPNFWPFPSRTRPRTSTCRRACRR